MKSTYQVYLDGVLVREFPADDPLPENNAIIAERAQNRLEFTVIQEPFPETRDALGSRCPAMGERFYSAKTLSARLGVSLSAVYTAVHRSDEGVCSIRGVWFQVTKSDKMGPQLRPRARSPLRKLLDDRLTALKSGEAFVIPVAEVPSELGLRTMVSNLGKKLDRKFRVHKFNNDRYELSRVRVH